MRFGYCTGGQSGDEWGIGFGLFGMLKDLGFDYVELPLAAMTQMPLEAFERFVLKGLRETGLPCHACNSFFPGGLRLTGPEVSMEAIRTYLAKALPLAAELGTRILVFGSGGARNLPPDFPKAQGYAQLAGMLAMAGPMAAEYGIHIAIEPLNRMESNIVDSYPSGLYLAALAGQENVGTLVDFYHFAVGNEPLEALEIRAPLHVHVASPLGRLLPLPSGDAALPAFMARLRSMGYADGCISLEGNVRGDLRAHLRESLGYLRAL